MNWNLIGHEGTVARLERAIEQGALRHALLFSGRSGLGKRTLALALAARLACREAVPPCGACRACRLIAHEAHPDLHVIRLREGRQRISRDDVAALRAQLFRRPTEAAYRVGIIADAERLGPDAENLLLRTLEEPAPRALLILTVEDANALLPTTVSRCQCIRLRPVPLKQIATTLVAQRGVDRERADLLARLSEGRPGWAIEAAADPDLLDNRRAVFERLERAAFGSRLERLEIARGLAESWSGKSAELRQELRAWSSWWRDGLLVASGLRERVANTDRLESLARAAERFGLGGLRVGARTVAQLQADLEQNANPRLAFDVALLGLP